MSYPKDIVNLILHQHHSSLVRKCITEYYDCYSYSYYDEDDSYDFPIRFNRIDEAYQYRNWKDGIWSNDSVYTNLKYGDIILRCNLPLNY